DDVQRDLAGILDAMRRADRDIRRLVFREQENLVVAGDSCRARDDDPMFGAVMMHLQRQHAARLDREVLDLKALAAIDAVVTAPGPEYLAMQRRLGATRFLELRDQFLDV